MATSTSPPPLAESIGELWRHQLGVAFAGLVPEPIDEGPAGGHISGTTLGDMGAFRVGGSPQVIRRTRQAVRREPCDALKVCLQMRGRAVVHQDGRELVIAPGHLGVYDTGRTYDLRLDGEWECAVITFRRGDLHMPHRWITEVMTHVHDASSGPGTVLTSFVDAALDTPLTADSDDRGARSRFAAAGMYLLGSALTAAAPKDCADEAGQAIKFAVLEHIRTHLREPGMSHRSVAGAHGISVRSLDRLFADEPESVTALIRNLRLDGARRDLLDLRSRHSSVGAIGARWCFPDAGHFSRVYTRRFGLNPSKERAVSVGGAI